MTSLPTTVSDLSVVTRSGHPGRRAERLFAEGIVAGTQTDLGSYSVSGAQIVEFARMWDPQPMHTDEQLASESPFGNFIASGIHTIAVLQRLTTMRLFSQWHFFAGRQFHSVRFLKPVPAGSVLHGISTVRSVEFNHPGRALVTSHSALSVEDVPVLDLVVEAYVLRADPAPVI